MPDSSIPGFFRKSRTERIRAVRDFASLSDNEIRVLESDGLEFERADKMVENAIGMFSLPLGIATNFRINGQDYLIPMATEEPSVIAAASKGAKTARVLGGFTAKADESFSIGQIQILDAKSCAIQNIQDSSEQILDVANAQSSTLSRLRRGAKSVSCKSIETDAGEMLIVELLIDVADAMGANVTNSMCEAVAPLIEEITGGRALLKILSNYSTKRLARASAVFDAKTVGGKEIVEKIVLAYQFAKYDTYRAVTHNKGVMNGCVAVACATGQDSRAIEAAAHAYAAKSGRYESLTKWSKNANGDLVGSLEMPLSVGVIGGIANVHPTAKLCAKILNVSSAQEIACVIAAAGLAQNYSAVRALATEGIQKGHMKLHARNIASAAGAGPDRVDEVSDIMIKEDKISLGRAKEILDT